MSIIELTKESTEEEWDSFFAVPKKVYSGDKFWIQENHEQIQNSLFKMLGESRYRCWPFVFLIDKIPVARAVGIKPPGGKKIGWIGYFEFLEKYERETIKLLETIENILKNGGIEKIIFPKIDNMQAGLQLSGFDLAPTVFTPHNPKYYISAVKKSGYVLTQKLVSFYFNKKIAKYVKSDSNVNIRHFDKNNLKEEIKLFHEFQINVFSSHYEYIPRNLKEETELINGLLPIIDEELIIIAEDKNKKIIGLIICLPDVNQKFFENKIDRARIVSIGVHPDHLRQGISKQMGNALMKTLIAKKYEYAEASWILKKNIPPQFLAKIFGAKKGRNFGIFEKKF